MMSHRRMTANDFKSKQSSFFCKKIWKNPLDKTVLGLFKNKCENVVCDVTTINFINNSSIVWLKTNTVKCAVCIFCFWVFIELTRPPTRLPCLPCPIHHRVASVPRSNKFHWKFIFVGVYQCVCVPAHVCECGFGNCYKQLALRVCDEP